MSEQSAARRRLAGLPEACRYGMFSRTKAYELKDAGKITMVKLEGKTLVDLDSIDRYIDNPPTLKPRR